MIKYLTPITFLILFFSTSIKAQLTPQNAVKGMLRGMNIGNTMEPLTGEGTWGNPPLKERAFDDYKLAGFTAVRIPITWGGYTSANPPYTIDSTWLNRVEQVVDWGLKRGLFIIINQHHEDWIKKSYNDTTVARFDSIWSQIAVRFKNKSDSLIFEIINEPYPMTSKHVNELNAQVLKIIRRTNPTRIVSFSGYMWSNSDELVTTAIPDTSDKYLIGYYHSYDPYPFGLLGPGTYGSNFDKSKTKAKFDLVTTWSNKHNIPVILDEFGYTYKCDYNSRMCAYGTVVSQAISHGVGAFAWDDGSGFPIYNRTTGGFNEIKDILIYNYPDSPDNIKIRQLDNASIKLEWRNKTTDTDSIVIQRNVDNSSFKDYAKALYMATEFVDSSIAPGHSYYYRLKIIKEDSVLIESYPIMLHAVLTSVSEANNSPYHFELLNNYPNPFNPSTEIKFSLAHEVRITLKVYNILGQVVQELINRQMAAGLHSVKFNGSNLPSGVYVYKLDAGNFSAVNKMLLLK